MTDPVDILLGRDAAKCHALFSGENCVSFLSSSKRIPSFVGQTEVNLRRVAELTEEAARYSSDAKNYFLVNLGMFLSTFLKFFDPETSIYSEVRDDITRNRAIGAVAFTEPTGGSDPSKFETRVLQGESQKLYLTGRKEWITFGNIANWILVYAKLESDSVFVLLPRKSSGVVTHEITPVLGNEFSGIGVLSFEKVEIDPSCVIPVKKNASGWDAFKWCIEVGRFLAGTAAIGSISTLLESIFFQLRAKVSFGTPLIQDSYWQARCARLYIELRALRCIREEALVYLENPNRKPNDPICSLFKVKASETYKESSLLFSTVLGARGYLSNSDSARHIHDSLSYEYIEGANTVIEKKIFSELLGQFITGGRL